MSVSFALGIPHAKGRPERRASLARLLGQLGILPNTAAEERGGEYLEGRTFDSYRLFDRVCHHSEWSSEMWHWQLRSGASHCLTLQDDVVVMPDFWLALHSMVRAVPDQVLALETVHPAARHYARNRIGRWITTADGLIGVQYVFPRELMMEFMVWRGEALESDATMYVTEDTLIDCFMLDTGRKAWHPIPAIAHHDVSLASTNNGNDQHPYRDVSVRWTDGDLCGWTDGELGTVQFWRQEEPPPHMGLFYTGTPGVARQWVKGFGDEKHDRAMANRCPEHFRKWITRV